MSVTKNSIINYVVVPILIVLFIGIGIVAIIFWPEKKEIIIVTEYKYSDIVTNVMEKYNLMEKYVPEGYTVKYREINNGADKRDALAAEQVHFISTSRTRMIPAIENGYPVAIVSSAVLPSMGVYSKKNGIRTLDDLSNCNKILTRSLTGADVQALTIIAKELYDDRAKFDDKYHIMALEFPEILGIAEADSNIDAVVLMFPYDAHALELGYHLVYDLTSKFVETGLFCDVYTTKNMVNNKLDIVEAYVNAQREANELLSNAVTEVFEHLSSIYGVNANLILHEIQKYPPSVEVVNYDKAAEMLLDFGVLKKTATKFKELFNYDKIPK